MASKKTMILGTSAAAVALLAGLGLAGVASAADSTGTATTSATGSTSANGSTESAPPGDSGQGGHRGGHRGGGGAADIAPALAVKLGVDESKLSGALKSFRQANKPGGRPANGTKPDRTQQDAALATSLAGSLGIDEAKATAALAELRAEKQGERAAALIAKLDAAVGAGTLTRAEADAVAKAVEKGVIGGR